MYENLCLLLEHGVTYQFLRVFYRTHDESLSFRHCCGARIKGEGEKRVVLTPPFLNGHPVPGQFERRLSFPLIYDRFLHIEKV